MSERQIVVSTALQHHQVHQLLTQYGIEHADEPIGNVGARFTFDAPDEQWEPIKAWADRTGASTGIRTDGTSAPATRLVDTGSFFVRVPKEES